MVVSPGLVGSDRSDRVCGEHRACNAATRGMSAVVADRSTTSDPSASCTLARGGGSRRSPEAPASSSSAAAWEISVAVNGQPRPSRTRVAPVPISA
nr:hypothetical protein [uncultured bacterium]